MRHAKVDFQVVTHGTVYLIYPNTIRAKEWVKDHLKDHMQFGGAAVVERQYIADIFDDIQSDQLDIAVSRDPLTS